MKIAKIGDTIEWSFPKDHNTVFAGETHRAEVAMVDNDEKCYGVYASYGQDLIPFNEAKIIKTNKQ